MPWDQFLMKKLLKSEVCRTRKQCMGVLFTVENSKHAAKFFFFFFLKKERNANVDP